MLAKIKHLVVPPQFPEDEEKTNTAAMLNVILITVFGVAVFLVSSLTLLNSLSLTVMYTGIAITVSTLLIWLVMKQGYIKLASILLASLLLSGTAAILYLVGSIRDPFAPVMLISVMIAALFVSSQAGVVFAGLSILTIATLYYLETEGLLPPYNHLLETEHWANFVGIVITVTVLFLLTNRGRNNSLRRIRSKNQELQLLTEKIQGRTQELEVMMEVGRSLNQVRDLGTLLKEASELICERFDLYQVQIYLADKSQKTLSPKAGAGQAGMKAVQRESDLSFGLGSINGIAAAEKRAVVVADAINSMLFRPNPLLPDTRSEMAVPLMVGETVIGVLNLQSDAVNGLSVENLPAFETLAGQIAVAVENALLFAETTQARAEIETYVRAMTREGWDAFQDGVTRPEAVGFAFENEMLQPLSLVNEPHSSGENWVNVPITIAGEFLGSIQLEVDDPRAWTEETQAVVTAVARQVGQQAENLRLLTETERYRQEAEMAARRLRGEAWRDYLSERQDIQQSYTYAQDQSQVLTEAEQLNENGHDHQAIKQFLRVQGETFGELLLDGQTDPETEALAAAVAEQLSNHLENLRLSVQIEKALAETAEQARRLAALNEISRDLSAITDSSEILTILSRHLASVIPHDFLSFAMANPNGAGAEIVAVINGQPVTLFEDQPFAGTVVEAAAKQRRLMYLADVKQHDYVDTNAMAERAGIRSVMVAPLMTARGVLGGIDLMSNQVDGFDTQDQTLLLQIATLTASTLENQQLFAAAQRQAEKEHLVNVITQKIQATVTMESALETAVTELGSALQTRNAYVELAVFKEQTDQTKQQISTTNGKES